MVHIYDSLTECRCSAKIENENLFLPQLLYIWTMAELIADPKISLNSYFYEVFLFYSHIQENWTEQRQEFVKSVSPLLDGVGAVFEQVAERILYVFPWS